MIPKTIHYIWLGNNPLSELAQKCINSWKLHCPDYEIKRWDESNLNLDEFSYVKQAYNEKKYAFASDVLRYQIIYNNGGVYLDIDVEIIKNIDNLLNNNAFMALEDDAFINPGLILGAEKGNLHLLNLLNEYKNTDFITEDGNYDYTTICDRATAYFQKLGFKQENALQKVDNIVIYPQDYFCPYSYKTHKLTTTSNTYAIHWCEGSWVPKQNILSKILGKVKQFIKFIIGEKNAKKLKRKFKGKKRK